MNVASPPTTPQATARCTGSRRVHASASTKINAIGMGPCAGLEVPTKSSSSPLPRQSRGAATSVHEGEPVVRRTVAQARAAAAMTIDAETSASARVLHPVAGSTHASRRPPRP